MLIARRVLAVVVAALAVIALGAWLTLSHARGTGFDEGYVQGELRRLDLYTFLAEELYPAIAEDRLEAIDEALSDSLPNLDLASEETVRAELTRVAQTAVPAGYVQAQAEELLDGLLPYLRGESDGFEIRPRLGERLVAVAGRENGAPSVLETAFRELDLGRVVIEQLEPRTAATGPVAGLPASEIDASAEWFTAELFDAADQLLLYLAGDTETVDIAVSFEGRELLAPALSGLLRTSPQELVAHGYYFTERDLRLELAADDDEQLRDVDDLRDALRPGWSLNEVDLLTRNDDPDALARAQEFRRNASLLFGPVRWGSLAVAVLLFAAAGLLGGRSWSSRGLWASGALVAGSLAIALVAVGVYELLLEPALHASLVERSADWAEPWARFRDRYVADVESVAGRLAGGFALRALTVAAAGAVLAGISAGFAYRTRRGGARPTRAA